MGQDDLLGNVQAQAQATTGLLRSDTLELLELSLIHI